MVGGGYIGLEMAEAFVRRGAEVTLVEAGEQVMGTLDPDMGALVGDAVRRHGIDLRTCRRSTGFEPGQVLTAAGAARRRSRGARPRRHAQQRAGRRGRPPHGDEGRSRSTPASARATRRCGRPATAASRSTWSRRPVHIALGTVANKQGRVAGINMGGGYATFPGVVGTAVTKVCATEVARTGLTEREAPRPGSSSSSATIESTTRPATTPAPSRSRSSSWPSPASGRLLGAQIVGEEGAAKRIDAVAVALHAGFTAQDLVDADLAYAPPFGPLWDPVAVGRPPGAEGRLTGPRNPPSTAASRSGNRGNGRETGLRQPGDTSLADDRRSLSRWTRATPPGC